MARFRSRYSRRGRRGFIGRRRSSRRRRGRSTNRYTISRGGIRL